MSENLYSGEVVIRSVTYSTNGGHKVTFEVEPEGWERFKGMETTRCAMVLVPIMNDQTPDPKPRRRMAEMGRAQQAGILCNDERFQKWICQGYFEWPPSDAKAAAENTAYVIRMRCHVKSRAEFDTDEVAGKDWDQLNNAWLAHIGRIAGPE